MIDMNKKYRNRQGVKAKILCVDAPPPFVVVALVGLDVSRYTAEGRYYRDKQSQHDLVEDGETSWSCAGDVPVGAVFRRSGGGGPRYVAVAVTDDGVTFQGADGWSMQVPLDVLARNWEWSRDGVNWFTCFKKKS